MPEKIDLTRYGENGVHFIMEALGPDMDKILCPDGVGAPDCYRTADVSLRVNGFEVPFTAVIDRIYSAIDDMVEGRTKTRLDGMTLDKVNAQVNALETILNRAKDDIEHTLNQLTRADPPR